MNSVGERLREARLARGLTQEQLARGLATKGFISQVERNHATPSLSKLRVIAERLGQPLSYFVPDRPPQQLALLRKAAQLAVRAEEPAQALDIVAEASALPATANERADLQRIRGVALSELRQNRAALSTLQDAAATVPVDDPELNASIYAEIGTVLHIEERFNAAIEASRRALDWLDRCRHADPELRARVLTNLGSSSFRLGQHAEAMAYYLRALDAATDAESLLRIANAHMALGVAARALGELDRALEHCHRADVHYAAGRHRQAAELQRACLERARELKDDVEIGVAAGELARYALADGEAAEAILLSQESQQAAGRSGDHLHQAVAAAVEGAAADLLGRRRVADRRFTEALRTLADREAAAELAKVCMMYADILRRREQDDRAFAFMRMAAERDFTQLPALLRK
ncbi:MAG: helix-turn-helix domain-containing protein [Chloroflexi bacterium]|nr:MAG: helix-turn-helix domain-containing protein [Chloroflexota bacterium]